MDSAFLVVVDGSRRVVSASRSGLFAALPFTPGQSCCEAFNFCGGDSARCPLLAALGGEPGYADVQGGEGRNLSLYAMPLTPTDLGGCAALVVRDETLQKEREALVNQSARLAAIGEMAAGVAHELNSPLTAVIGNANLLIRRAPEGDRALPLLTDIKSAGQRAKKIIENLLTFSRRDSFRFAPVSLNEVAQNALALVRFQLEKEEVEVVCDLNPGLPQVLGNLQQLEQVVVNLLLNARDAVRGGAERRLRLSSDYCALGGERFGVAVSVADSGPGIEPEKLTRIFHPFFTTKEGEKGTGLGLSVSLGIAKAHGGSLTVESKPGLGASFSLVLPLLPDRLVLEGDEALPTEGETSFLGRVRPKLKLARALARVCFSLTGEPPAAVTVACRGSTEGWGAGLVTAAFLEGLLAPDAPFGSTLATCRSDARERGIAVAEVASGTGGEFRFSLEARVSGAYGTLDAVGALVGRNEARLLSLGGFSIETPLSGNILFVWASDRPGLVGAIASALSARGISMLQMRSGEANDKGVSLATFHLDSPGDGALKAALKALDGIERVEAVTL